MRYFIDRDKRTVVAVMSVEFEDKDPADSARDYVLAKMNNFLKSYNIDPYWMDLVFCRFVNKYIPEGKKYVGVAKCAPEDEWDEERGVRLARARALAKYYQDCANIGDDISNFVWAMSECVGESADAAYGCVQHWEEVIDTEGENK